MSFHEDYIIKIGCVLFANMFTL